jgi:hypothetical protein
MASSTQPYYRRRKPKAQNEWVFVGDMSLKQIVMRLRELGVLPPGDTINLKELRERFRPDPPGSMRVLLLKMRAHVPEQPHIDLARAHMEPYRLSNPLSGLTLKQVVKYLRDYDVLLPGDSISVAELNRRFRPDPPGSMRSLLLKMRDKVLVAEANYLFDKRAAAAVFAAVGLHREVRVFPNVKWIPLFAIPHLPEWPFHVDDYSGTVSGKAGEGLSSDRDLLEMKFYGDAAPTIYIVRAKCLAAMAYADYFPAANTEYLWNKVSEACLAASPGWCGSIGPNLSNMVDYATKTNLEGNYDMSEMRMLPLLYRYYDRLSPEAREWLITALLAKGTIHRIHVDDTFTSGGTPDDWSRAGFVEPFTPIPFPMAVHVRIGETENHILMILTARYLTNQLLYQRDHLPIHDNRRNGNSNDPVLGILLQTGPHCTQVLLEVLRGFLSNDFSEYNAKPYQTETRAALLNLCSYAYDHEVRLAARMVLDYISAHIVVSSNDLRRMVPFRRKNEGKYVTEIPAPYALPGVLNVGLLESWRGADPMVQHFAIQAGNTRAFEYPYEDPPRPDRPWAWSIAEDGLDSTLEALSDYRLPPSIHDLFVNDLHRRFFQRLHRTVQGDVEVTGHNADNMEIYAGSPSYLITAGGKPADYAINPRVGGIVFGDVKQQLGVAVTTSFMPTGLSAGINTQNNASDLIQFSSFSDEVSTAANYGVAPDFACGHRVHLPEWCKQAIVPQRRGKFDFVNKRGADGCPGFYLALLRDGDFTAMEAFDTWLHPDVTFEQFKSGVVERNKHLHFNGLNSNVEAQYTTHNGNRLTFVIWDNRERNLATFGAQILSIEYGVGDSSDPTDSIGDAGNITDRFLNGTIMNSPAEGVVEITNPFLGTKIRLDMSDPKRPRRTSETGEVEEAGSNHEVWVDFAWTGPGEGDFFHPFRTLAEATVAVADGGVIKIMPGSSNERHIIRNNKRVRLVAPIGGVTIGVR